MQNRRNDYEAKDESKLKICVLVLALLFCLSALDEVSGAGSEYRPGHPYRVVYVSQGDSLWSIAAHSANENTDIRRTIAAIREINGLAPTAQIHPGQALKIPAKPATGDTFIARLSQRLNL